MPVRDSRGSRRRRSPEAASTIRQIKSILRFAHRFPQGKLPHFGRLVEFILPKTSAITRIKHEAFLCNLYTTDRL